MKTKITKRAKELAEMALRVDLREQREELADAISLVRIDAIRDSGLNGVFEALAYKAIQDTELEEAHGEMSCELCDLDLAIRFLEDRYMNDHKCSRHIQPTK